MADDSSHQEFVPLPEFVAFRKEVRADVRSIMDAVSELTTRQAVTGKLDGKTIIGLVSVMLAALMGTITIIGVIGTMALGPIRTNIAELKENVHLHQSDGHPEASLQGIARAAANIARIEKLMSEDNENEIVIAGKLATLQASLVEIETQFREAKSLRQMADAASDRVRGVEQGHIDRRLAGIEGWKVDHDKRVIGLNAAQWERIRAIERSVFGTAGAGAAVGSGG